MTGEGRAIRSIAVLGAGIVGLSAAIAFARALPRTRIVLVATPPDPAALADRMPGTLPTVHRFHRALGLDELALVADGIATHLLGTRFENWPAGAPPWFHVHGEYGRPVGAVPFHNLWARARRAGRADPFDSYAPAAALAGAGKFVHPEDRDGSLLATYLYGLRLDPDRYRERLDSAAGTLPVARVAGALAGIERREDGGVAAILLGGGTRIEADLFVDCAGPAAPLLAAVGGGFEDWADFLPCDRLLLGAAPASRPGSCDRATGVAIGWHWRSPLPDRTIAGLAYDSALASGDEALRVAREAGIDPDETVAIRSGCRPQPWIRNVLALGDAAAAFEPLQSANLHLAQQAILRALDLLPGRDCHPLELAEYNRLTGQETGRVRDFLALHHLRRARLVPESLARTLTQFERRGRLPFFEEETFDSHGWAAVLLGMGIVPRDPDPAAEEVDAEEAAAAMARLAAEIAALPARLPPYRDYLARMARPKKL